MTLLLLFRSSGSAPPDGGTGGGEALQQKINFQFKHKILTLQLQTIGRVQHTPRITTIGMVAHKTKARAVSLISHPVLLRVKGITVQTGRVIARASVVHYINTKILSKITHNVEITTISTITRNRVELFLKIFKLHTLSKAVEALSNAEGGAISSDMFVDPNFLFPIAPVVYHTEEDRKVDDECDVFDGMEFDFDDPNKPLLPLHPNCRCWYEYKDTGEKVHFRGSEWEGF